MAGYSQLLLEWEGQWVGWKPPQTAFHQGVLRQGGNAEVLLTAQTMEAEKEGKYNALLEAV